MRELVIGKNGPKNKSLTTLAIFARCLPLPFEPLATAGPSGRFGGGGGGHGPFIGLLIPEVEDMILGC